MALSTLWVLLEPAGDSFTSTSLEVLSQARTLSDNVAGITWGGGAALAAQAGDFGATTLYDVGDLAGALPGVPVASAIAALIEREGAPDAVCQTSPSDSTLASQSGRGGIASRRIYSPLPPP